MFSKLSKITAVTAFAVTTALAANTGPAEAKDWRSSLDRHYTAAEATKYTPKGKKPQWDFNLGTVVNDMAWRTRTASMLRNAPKPSAPTRYRQRESNQLADRPEPQRLPFSF